MKQLTLNELKKLVDAEVKKGNGDKIIIVSDDAEGNGYHGIWHGFTDGKLVDECIQCSNGVSDSETKDPNKLIILD